MRMDEYRDYGTIGDSGTPGVSVDTTRYGQVFQATHETYGHERLRLPFMKRSFISFSFGYIEDAYGQEVPKYIEDFNLIAVNSGDRWERDGYTTFEDRTSTYDNLDGQYYWSTHYKSHTITFTLATDGIDQRMLDDFLHWFQAGVSRELILSEHPNRAQMARVAEPPQLSLLPFEGQSSMIISGEERKVTTTLFKGNITLKLVMDDPHWYALDNILGKKITEYIEDTHSYRTRYVDWWLDANGQEVEIAASQDALKILYEDGIPLGSMIENNMLLGNQAYANVENHTEMLVWSVPEASIQIIDGEVSPGEGARIDGTITTTMFAERSREYLGTESGYLLSNESNEYIKTDLPEDFVPDYREYNAGKYVGIIAGAIIDVTGNGITSLAKNQEGFFYYAGNAPSPTIISFTLHPDNTFFDFYGYFKGINNSYTNPGNPYNTIIIEADKQQELKLTTPNIITSYNTAVSILQTYAVGLASVIDIRDKIIKEVRHPAVRKWASALVSDEGDISQLNTTVIAEKMSAFFKTSDNQYADMTFSFNSKTGEAIGELIYRAPTQTLSLFDFSYAENALNKISTISSEDATLTDKKRYENLVTWGWSQFCIVGGSVYTPDPADESTYTVAVTAFLDYYTYCRSIGRSMDTIFVATQSIIQSSDTVTTIEDVGDMLKSNNIIITERNHPNEFGKITRWQNNSSFSRTNSHRITHDFDVPLYNLQVIYKNMYL